MTQLISAEGKIYHRVVIGLGLKGDTVIGLWQGWSLVCSAGKGYVGITVTCYQDIILLIISLCYPCPAVVGSFSALHSQKRTTIADT